MELQINKIIIYRRIRIKSEFIEHKLKEDARSVAERHNYQNITISGLAEVNVRQQEEEKFTCSQITTNYGRGINSIEHPARNADALANEIA